MVFLTRKDLLEKTKNLAGQGRAQEAQGRSRRKKIVFIAIVLLFVLTLPGAIHIGGLFEMIGNLTFMLFALVLIALAVKFGHGLSKLIRENSARRSILKGGNTSIKKTESFTAQQQAMARSARKIKTSVSIMLAAGLMVFGSVMFNVFFQAHVYQHLVMWYGVIISELMMGFGVPYSLKVEAKMAEVAPHQASTALATGTAASSEVTTAAASTAASSEQSTVASTVAST